jgi:hypothetical protein
MTVMAAATRRDGVSTAANATHIGGGVGHGGDEIEPPKQEYRGDDEGQLRHEGYRVIEGVILRFA